MLTVLEYINLSTEYLKKKGIESPKLNAELLLAHILKCKRIDLYLSFDRPLKQDEIDQYRETLKRRASNEPLQYITGMVEFYGLQFKVDPSVLIPRQETEILVEAVLNSCNKNKTYNILDIGTGSGIIAICLAKMLSSAKLSAIDVSEEALSTSAQNARLNNVEEKIVFELADITMENSLTGKFDIIVSNPPYVSAEDYKNLAPELRLHEPLVALTDSSDGLSLYRAICKRSSELLNSGGKIFFEIGFGQAREIEAIMIENNFKNIRIIKDLPGIERVITGELNC